MQILTFGEEEAGQSPSRLPPSAPSNTSPLLSRLLSPLQEPIYRKKNKNPANYRNTLAFGFIFIH